jgi:hypothetical protein
MEYAAPSDRQGIADEAKNALVKAITNNGPLDRGVHLDSGGRTERSCGSRQNPSAHPLVAQVVPVGHVWVMRIKRYDKSHIVETHTTRAEFQNCDTVWRKLPSVRGKSPRVRGFADFYQRFF